VLVWYIGCALVYAVVSALVFQIQSVWYQSTLYPLNTNIPSVCILPKTARDLTRLVLGFEHKSGYQCCVFRVAFSPGINLAMIMCFKLYPFSYFEFALNLFMSEVGCSLAELSSMCLLFLSVFQWLQSGFRKSTLIALVMHNMEWISMDETLKNERNETLDLYQSWKFIPAGIMLVILILIPLHHEIGYLELLIPDWYMSLGNSLLVPVSYL